MTDYLTDFVQESEEHITELNNALLALERSPDDDEAMEAVFRIAHTLKGNCGAMGLEPASDLAHAIEDLLDAVRADALEVSPALMDVVFDAVDELETMVDEVAERGEIETDPSSTIRALRDHLDAQTADASIEAPSPDELDDVLARFDPPADDDHDAYLARLEIAERDGVNNGALVVEALIDAFDLIGTVPSRDAIDADEYGGSFDAVFGSAVGETAITSGLEPVEEVADFELVRVTDRLEAAAAADEDEAAADDDGISTAEAQDLEVDDLLEEFDEFDDLDEKVEELDGDDLDAFEDMGDAGSFEDLLGDDALDLEADPGEPPASPAGASASDSTDERGTDPAGAAADAGTDDVDDASAVFDELKAEVEMVGFDELQDELAELEFDEFDDEDEIGMDELLGDEFDDDSFLEGDEPSADEVDDLLVDSTDGDDCEPVDASEPASVPDDAPVDDEAGEGVTDEAEGDEHAVVDPGDALEATDAPAFDADGDFDADRGATADDAGTDLDPADDAATPLGPASPADDPVAGEAADGPSDEVSTESTDDPALEDDEPGAETSDDPDEIAVADPSDDDVVVADPADEVAVADDEPTAAEPVDETAAVADDVAAVPEEDVEETTDEDSLAAPGDGTAADGTADEAVATTDVPVFDAGAAAPEDVAVTDESALETSEEPAADAPEESPDDAVAEEGLSDGVADEPDAGADADGSVAEGAVDDPLAAEGSSIDEESAAGAAEPKSTDSDRMRVDDAEPSPADPTTSDESPVEPEFDDAPATAGDADAEESDDETVTFDEDAATDETETTDETVTFEDAFEADLESPSESDADSDASVDDPFDDAGFDDGFDDDSFGLGDADFDDSADDDPFADVSADPLDLEEAGSADSFEDAFGDPFADADDAVGPSDDAFGTDSAAFGDESDGDGTDLDDGETRIVDEPALEIPDVTLPERTDRERDADRGADENQSVRVDVEQIDSLLTLVEGLVTSRVRLRHAIEEGEDLQAIAAELDDLEELTTDLQETVMDVRLVPLNTVTTRLPRVVRDIARDQGKEVAFEMSGEDVELDRSILDRIGDPLIHLVRNAVDHGIEPPERREAADKPPEGTVTVTADRSRDRVRITVADDGSGLDPDRLRTEAVEAGLLTESEAAELADDEVVDLVFHPGLSTADEVTDVSGRGVGMDVVERTIADLDGTVSVDSTPGEGTTVTMTLPVTVAIDDVLFLESGDEEFGVPLEAVHDIEPGDAVETVDGDLVVSDDDESRPLIHLGEALETPGAGAEGDGMVVRIRDEVRSVALHCDHVHGQQEVVVTPFEGFMSEIPGISGATVRGRGEVVNILDVTTL